MRTKHQRKDATATVTQGTQAGPTRQDQLTEAYRAMGGTANTSHASIPKLEKAITDRYENSKDQYSNPLSGVLNGQPLAQSVSNYMQAYNARQAAAPVYNEIKNAQTQQTLETLGQTEQARQGQNPFLEQAANMVVGALTGGVNFAKPKQNLTQEMANAGLTEEDLERWNKPQNQAAREQTIAGLATAHPLIATGLSVPSNLVESADNVIRKGLNYVTGEAMEANPTNADIARQAVSQNININSPEWLEKLGVTDEALSNVGRLGYSGVNSIADMLFSMLMTGGGSKAADAGKLANYLQSAISALPLGVEKASATMNDAVSRGLTPTQILGEGGLSAASTALTEALPFERFSNGGNILGSMLAEGLQEGAEDIADTFFDELVTKLGGNYDKSSLRQDYLSYRNAGYTEEDAKRAVVTDYAKQLGIDTLLGGITGGIMQGGTNLVSGRQFFNGKPRNIPTLENEQTAEAKPVDLNEVKAEAEEAQPIPAVEKPVEQTAEQRPIPTVNAQQNNNIRVRNYDLEEAQAAGNAILQKINDGSATRDDLINFRNTIRKIETPGYEENPIGDETFEAIENLANGVEAAYAAKFPENATRPVETVAEPTQPKPTRTELRQYKNIAEQYKDKLDTFNNHAYDAQIDAALEAVVNGDPNAVENFNNLIASIDEAMNEETIGEAERNVNKAFYDQMKAATDGRVVHVSQDILDTLGLTVNQLNNKISTGVGKLRFVKNGGSPIDSVYTEIYDMAGGMLPDPASLAEGDMYNALINYMTNFKSEKGSVVNERSWADTPLTDMRTDPVSQIEDLADELLDSFEAGTYGTKADRAKAFEDFVKKATELSKKYPKVADDIYNVVENTSQAYRDMVSKITLDDDIKAAQTVEEVQNLANQETEKAHYKYDLQMFAEPDNDVNGVHTGRFKESRVFTNEKIGMTDRQVEEHRKANNMLYEENSEKESMDEAYKNLNEYGREDEKERLLDKDGWTNVDVDEAFILWQIAVDEAKALDAAGEDSSAAWEDASKFFEKIKNEGSRKGQSLQAFAKWSRNCTPEGLLSEAATILREYQEGLDRYKKYSWTKEVRRETKPGDSFAEDFVKHGLDADFMKRFLQEADGLYTGDFNMVKQLTDGYTIHVTPKMVKDLGFDSLADLNRAVYTDTDNSIKFTYDTKGKDGKIIKSLKDAYTEMYKKASDKLSDPGNMNDASILNNLVEFITKKGRMINLDSRSAKHTMANLGAMVNEQMPSNIAERVTTFLMDNMLGNVRTLITRNAGGNVGFNLMEQFLRKPLSAFIDSKISQKHGTARTISGFTREGWDAWKEGFKEGLAQEFYDFKNDIQSARSGENSLRTAVSNNRNNVFDISRRNKETGKLETLRNSKIFQKYNKLVKAGLSIGDRPFYEATYKQSMTEYNRMYKEGKFGDLSREKFEELAQMHAKLNALAAVYQDDTRLSEAFVGMKQAIGKMSEGIVGADILSQFSMPFVKTPANIIERSIEYSPLGLVKNAIQTIREINSDRIDFNQERFATETSRNIIGTLLFAIGIGMAQAGRLTGGYSDDKDMKQAQKEAGMQEYALHTGMGDFDLSWIPVLGNNLVSAAAAYDSAKRSDTEGLQALSNGATAGVKSQFDTSMLQGLQRLVGSGGNGSYNSEADVVTNAANTLKSGVTQFVPSLLRQTAAFMDPNQRQLSGPNQDDYYKNQFLNSIPGLRQTLEPKIGRTGEELQQNVGQGTVGKFLSNFISPATWTQGTEDAVRDEAMRLFESTGNNVAFEPTVSIGDLKTEDHVPTPEEFTEYQREAYGGMNRVAQQMINSEYYAALNDGDREQMLADIYSAVKSVAKANALGKDPNELSGAAKAYATGGDAALLDYVTARNALSAMGMSNSEKNRETILETLQTGGADAVQSMVNQSQELADAGLDTNMQFRYEHAAQYIPTLTPTQFAQQFQAIDQQPEGTTGHGSIKQSEIIDYLNRNPSSYTDQSALQIWSAYLQEYAKIPVLNSDGYWEAKKP